MLGGTPGGVPGGTAPCPPSIPSSVSVSPPTLPRIGVSVKQQFTEEEIYKDRDSQIAAIEKTFEDAQKAVRGGSFFLPPPGVSGGLPGILGEHT